MDYSEWNKRLVAYFFRPENVGSEVILCIDQEFLKTHIAPELGDDASHDFVRAAITSDFTARPDRTICDKALELLAKDLSADSDPAFLGYLCVMVLAWTLDPELHAGNYYDRLHGMLLENGQAPTTPKIDTQRFKVTKCLWGVLSFWADRYRSGRLGTFRFASIGSNEYIGYPLRHALLSASDREKLLRLFVEKESDFPNDKATPERMRPFLERYLRSYFSWGGRSRFLNYKEEVCQRACDIYDSWNGDLTLDAESVHIVRLWLVINVGRTGRKNLRLRLDYKNGDFPGEEIIGTVYHDDTRALTGLSFTRYQNGCSGDALSVGSSTPYSPDRLSLSDGFSIAISGVRRRLRIRGVSGGVLYFDDLQFGVWRQSQQFRIGRPCLVLIDSSLPQAQNFLEKNASVLSPSDLGTDVGWRLYSSDGLIDITGFLTDGSLSDLRLVGGGKLHAMRRIYHRHALPSVQCTAVASGGVVQICEMSAGHPGPVLKSVALPLTVLLPLSSDDLSKASEFMVRLMVDGKLIESLTFMVQTAGLDSSIEDRWPGSIETFFPFDGAVVLSGVTDSGHVLRKTGQSLSAHVEPEDADWRLRLDDGPVFEANKVILPSAGMSIGRHELIATWRGVVITRQGFEVKEVPACDIIGPIGVASIGSNDVDGKILRYPCDDFGLSFRIEANRPLKVVVTVADGKPIYYEGLELQFKVHLPKEKDLARAEIYCYIDGQRYLDSKTIVMVRLPRPQLTIFGDRYSASEVYRADSTVEFTLTDLGVLTDERLTLKVGDAFCIEESGSFLLPDDLCGSDLPIRLHLGSRPMPHVGPDKISIAQIPVASMRLVGGIRDQDGNYYKGRCPRIEVHPWSHGLHDVAEIHWRGQILPLSGLGTATLPMGADVGSHHVLLRWRGELLDEKWFTLVAPPSCRLVFDRRPDVRDYYLPGMLPDVIAEDLPIGAQLFAGEDIRIPLQPTGGTYPLPPTAVVGGKVVVRALLQDFSIYTLGAKFLDDTWLRLGPAPGRFADVGDKIDWQPCWYLKRGRRMEAILSKDCPGIDCADCGFTRLPAGPDLKAWKDSASWNPELTRNEERRQWRRFVEFRRRSR